MGVWWFEEETVLGTLAVGSHVEYCSIVRKSWYMDVWIITGGRNVYM
jgi:hypothetical protein